MRGRGCGLWILGLVLYTLVGCGSEPLPPLPAVLPGDPFAPEALEARLERVRPAVEDLIGRSLGEPVQVIVADRTEWSEQFATAGLAMLPPGTADDAIEPIWYDLRHQARSVHSRLLYANVWRQGDAIWIVPEAFDPVPKALLGDVLDIVLAHELVHVHQHRHLRLQEGEELRPGNEARLTLSSIAEGHAQWVARRVGERLGLMSAFTHLVNPRLEPPSLADGPAVLHFWHEQLALFDLKYRTGETFVAAVIESSGYANAIKRLFTAPPRRVRTIQAPGDWIAGQVQGEEIGVRSADIALAFGIKAGSGTVQLPPLVKLGLPGASEALVSQVLAGLDESQRFEFEAREGSLRDASGTADISTFTSAATANQYLEAQVAALALPNAPCYLSGTALHTVGPELDAGDGPGARLRLSVQHAGMAGPIEVDVALVRLGSSVLQVTMPGRPRGTDATYRLTSRLAALLDPTLASPALSPAKAGRQVVAYADAARSSPDWRVRLRAVVRLASLPGEDTSGRDDNGGDVEFCEDDGRSSTCPASCVRSPSPSRPSRPAI